MDEEDKIAAFCRRAVRLCGETFRRRRQQRPLSQKSVAQSVAQIRQQNDRLIQRTRVQRRARQVRRILNKAAPITRVTYTHTLWGGGHSVCVYVTRVIGPNVGSDRNARPVGSSRADTMSDTLCGLAD